MATMAMLPPLPSLDRPIPIPPSLMLHSPHGRGDVLARLLDGINEAGFTAVTYRGWLQHALENRPMRKPILISIDDLTLSEGITYAWDTFHGMQQTLVAAGMVATYGVITTPVIEGQVYAKQDAERWDMMADWVNGGFELASHTSFHSCFSNRQSLARADFDQADYDAEICDSAELIERELNTRGVDYTIETLILPYGSGYSYSQPQPRIHEPIVQSCRKTAIRMVAGIPQGREPFTSNQIHGRRNQLYMGRCNVSVSDGTAFDVATTLYLLNQWSEANQAHRRKGVKRPHRRVRAL